MGEAGGRGFPMSNWAKRSVNPIRTIVDTLEVPKAPEEKPLIALSIGDPTIFGNLKTPQVFIEALCEAARDYGSHGYSHSAGKPETRAAIAKRYSLHGAELTSEDVIVASGCSGALDIAIRAVASEGENILVPCPGFPLYQTLAESSMIKAKAYRLVAESNWEVDIASLENAIDSNTRGIVITNPSNPCGSVYSAEHLGRILEVAEKHRVIVIADEIYGRMVFQGVKFVSIASLTSKVPILCVGGVAKEFLVPGFRVGWILKHDRNNQLGEIWKGALRLTQLIIGANTLVQTAVPAILDPTPGSKQERELEQFNKCTNAELERSALFLCEKLRAVRELTLIEPKGAMYIMVGIRIDQFDEEISDDISFSQLLLKEEFVFVLPGACFGLKNFVRIVCCAPIHILQQACERIQAFCKRHGTTERGPNKKHQKRELN